jgi:hypothetical protein
MTIPGFSAEAAIGEQEDILEQGRGRPGEPRALATAEQGAANDETGRRPYRMSLPGFIGDDIGLGDVIKRMTSAVGIPSCGGCLRRAQALNAWVVLSRRSRRA